MTESLCCTPELASYCKSSVFQFVKMWKLDSEANASRERWKRGHVSL